MDNSYKDLPGKTAVVTGASRGIGKSIAEGFCKKGMNVALFDVDAEALSQTVSELKKFYPQGPILGVECDISRADSVESGISRVRKEFSEIDILINNAGILKRSPLETMEDSDWNTVIGVNLSGAYFCSRAVVPSMKEKGSGVIVNVSSNVAAMPSVGMGAYCITKSAVETLTRVLAAELAPYNIRVNAYAPGVIMTEMTKDILSTRAEEKLKTIPLRRFGKPEDIASLVLFLCSDASSYIDGTTVSIDGGMLSVHNPWKAWV